MKLNKKQKRKLVRIIISALLLLSGLMLTSVLEIKGIYSLLFVLPSYIVAGWDVALAAVREITRGRFFGEELLMTLSGVGALRIGEWAEGVAIMLFFQVGALFESYASSSAKNAIKALAKLCPDKATVIRDGESLTVDIEDVAVGESVIVMSGEKVPLDGVIINGGANFSTAQMTGESLPVYLTEGDTVMGGFISTDSRVIIRVTKKHNESGSARIIALMEEASLKKSKNEDFVAKFAVVYTPIVVFAAIIIAFVPPIFFGNLSSFVHKGLTFLVVSCPCALVISVPLTYFSAVGSAARKGIIFKSNLALETLAGARICAFDKTGTLTDGVFGVDSVLREDDVSEKYLFKLASSLEAHSNHPIAVAIRNEYSKNTDGELFSCEDVREIKGLGTQAVLDGEEVLCGSLKLLLQRSVIIPEYVVSESEMTAVYISRNGRFLGAIFLSDKIKESSYSAIESLKRMNIKSVMLTGDSDKVARRVSERLSFDGVHSSLLPDEKVAYAERLKSEGTLVYTGDGLNDAPIIAVSDVGIAMGAMGSDISVEAADAVIVDDNPTKIPYAIALAKYSDRIVKQNVIFALTVKFGVLAVGAITHLSLWWAVFADVGVSVIAILNAMRTRRFRYIDKK